MAIDPHRAPDGDREPYADAGVAPNAAHAAVPGGPAIPGYRSHGPQGTTHDPNSNTTGTEVEPTSDVYPPKGERAEDRALDGTRGPARPA